jgi:hypothetical protein
MNRFERLEGLDPGSPWVSILRAQAYDGMGSYVKALAEFEEAEKQLPADATCDSRWASCAGSFVTTMKPSANYRRRCESIRALCSRSIIWRIPTSRI